MRTFTALSILLVLSAFVVSISAQDDVNPKCGWLYQNDLYGYDIDEGGDVASSSACCDRCSAIPTVNGYEYHIDNRYCWCKRSPANVLPAYTGQNHIYGDIGVRRVSLCPGWEMEDLIDYNNVFDLASYPNTDQITDCCQRCSAYRGNYTCTAFTWNHVDHTCYLKSGRGNPIQSGTTMSAYLVNKTAAMGMCAAIRMNQVDFYGADITEFPAGNSSHCCSYCSITDGCRAFTYHTDTGRCFLKYNHGDIRQNMLNMESGYYPEFQPQQCGGVTVPGIDYYGDDLVQWPGVNPAVCCQHCAAYPGCTAWTHNPPYCFLKSGTGTPIPNTAVVSGHYPAAVTPVTTGPQDGISKIIEQVKNPAVGVLGAFVGILIVVVLVLAVVIVRLRRQGGGFRRFGGDFSPLSLYEEEAPMLSGRR